MRARNRETLCTPELGAAAFTTVNMGVQSYRQGKVLFWDKERRRPTEADSSWATRLERKSHERGQPTQVIGWTGGTSLAWAGLAVWRTLSLDTARFAVLAAFGLLNLALVSRVIFAGGSRS